MEAVRTPLVSEIRDLGGAPTLFIDGRPQTGLMHWNRAPSPEDIEVFRDAGIHLYSFMGIPPMPDPAGGETSYEDGFAAVPVLTESYIDTTLSMIEAADPEAAVLVRLPLRTPSWWREAHPEARVRAYRICEGKWVDLPWATAASREWLDLAASAMRRTIDYLETRWPHRILGYHPGIGCCSENTYEWGASIADCSPAQQSAFGGAAPDPERFISRRADDARRLLDPVADADAIAYMRHQSSVMAEATCFLAHTVKDELRRLGRRKLCGVFYGYLCLPVGNADLLSAGHNDHQRVLSCQDVDFISAPVDYGARFAGGAALAQALPGSIAANGKLYWAEDDTRYHLASDVDDCVSCDTETTRAILLRNFTDAFSHGGTVWWMDLFGRGWYRDRGFVPTLSECRHFAEAHFADRRSVAQMAVFANPDAVACERAAPVPLSNELVAAELAEVVACGAPYDIFTLQDLPLLAEQGRLDAYRLAIVLNAHAADANLRAIVRRTLQTGGRTVLFLGAPGYICDSASGPELVRDLTGIGVAEVQGTGGMAVEAFTDGRRMVFGQTHCSVPKLVVADDGARPLGWHVRGGGKGTACRRGGVALAEKAFQDWTSVVCLANALPSDLIRHFAEKAGVHIYSPHGDQVFAGPGWFAVAAKMPGEHLLSPRANGAAQFRVPLERGDFAFFEDGD